jgi:hypothetical protein
MSPVAVLRQAMSHFQRLLLVGAESGTRRNHRFAMRKKCARRCISRGSPRSRPGAEMERSQAGEALDLLLETEALCKTTAVPAEAACGRALFNVAAMAQNALMLKVRIIPCLDVKDGRVVKGVNFVDLRDAGDPVEQAMLYDAAGADELCFLDITASHEKRGILLDVVRRTADVCFMPLTVGGGVRTLDDIRAAAGRRRQGLDQHRSGAPAGIRARGGGEIRQPVHRRRHRRQAGRVAPGRFEVFTHGGRNPTGIDAVAMPSSWSNTARAKSCSPRWTATAPRSATTSR